MADATRNIGFAAPSVGWLIAKVTGMTMADWVTVLTLIVLTIQGVYMLWKFRKEVREAKLNGTTGKLAALRAPGDD